MNSVTLCLWLTDLLLHWCELIVFNLSFWVYGWVNPWIYDFVIWTCLCELIERFFSHIIKNISRPIVLDLDKFWPLMVVSKFYKMLFWVLEIKPTKNKNAYDGFVRPSFLSALLLLLLFMFTSKYQNGSFYHLSC